MIFLITTRFFPGNGAAVAVDVVVTVADVGIVVAIGVRNFKAASSLALVKTDTNFTLSLSSGWYLSSPDVELF